MLRYGLLLALVASGLHGVAYANEFNPNIAVHFDGLYYHDTTDGEGAELLGSDAHGHEGHAHDSLSQGFNLQETELAIWGTVDPLFDAWLGVTAHGGGEISLEEAWVRTRALPAGLQIKAGQFLSGVGYHNEKHLHEWSFVDQNLAYARLLGIHGLLDTAVQVTWLAPTPWFLQLGAEALQGDELHNFGARVDEHELEENALGGEHGFHKDGPGVAVLFARTGPDLGFRHALQFGVSWAHQRSSGTWLEDHLAAAKGTSDLVGTQFVYKRFATGAYNQGSVTLQGEWFLLDVDERIDLATDPLLLGLPVEHREQAGYLQAVWGIAPRWSLGARTSVVGVNAETLEADHEHEAGSSRQHSVALTWHATEFSRLRLQFSHNDLAGQADDGHDEQFNQVMLQYSLSLGAHGAHAF